MFDLQLLNKVNEVEKQTGESLPSLLSKVPLGSNMFTVEKLQSKFGSRSIILAINKLTERELQSLLTEDNFDIMSDIIENLAFVSYRGI